MDAYIDSNGLRLHYLDHPGEGPTLILMPGLTANAHAFDGVVAAGLSPGLRVLALDLRGRGLSDKPASGYSMADHAGDVLALMDRLELDRAILGGHSFGGLLTYYLASHHGDRFTRCIVLDAPAVVDAATVEQIRPALARLGQPVASFADYLAAVRAMPYFADWWDPAIEAYYRADVEERADGSVVARSKPAHIEPALQATMEHDWLALCRRIAQPTLLIRAAEPFGPPGSPPILTRDKADATCAALSDARLVEVAGNHMTMLFGACAPIVAQAITSFVSDT